MQKSNSNSYQRKETQEIDPDKIVPLPFLRVILSPLSYKESFHNPWFLLIAFYTWLIQERFLWKPKQLASLLRIPQQAVHDMELPWPSPQNSPRNSRYLITDLEDQIDETLAKYLENLILLKVKPTKSKMLSHMYVPRGFRRHGYNRRNASRVRARDQKYRSNRHNTHRGHKATWPRLVQMSQTCFWNMRDLSTPVCLRQVIAKGRRQIEQRYWCGQSRYVDILQVDFSNNRFDCQYEDNKQKLGDFGKLLTHFHVISFANCTMDRTFKQFLFNWMDDNLHSDSFLQLFL